MVKLITNVESGDQELFEADRTRSLQIQLHAVLYCSPIFTAACNPNYLKSTYLYLQNISALEIENHEVFQKFMSGYHAILRRTSGLDLVVTD